MDTTDKKDLQEPFQNPIPDLKIPLAFQWSDLSYTLNKPKKEILKSIFGQANPGKITAIIGQSGAGKSTLLNILAGVISTSSGKVSGDLSINGSKVRRSYVTSVSSYLRQEDIYHHFFNPNELLEFAAKLRIPGTNKERQAQIDQLIKNLNLEKCRETIIGNFEKKGVSGGEKRRISMALEMLVNPSILFLDEPTSGLDSFSALLMMGLLKKEAKKGRTVICSIHQPSFDILKIIDHVIVLHNGVNVYNGSPRDIVSRLSEFGMDFPKDKNPFDQILKFVNETSCKNSEENIKNFHQSSLDYFESNIKLSKIESSNTLPKRQTAYSAGFFTKLWFLLIRTIVSTFRDPKAFYLYLVQTTIIASFGAILYHNLNQNYGDGEGKPVMNRIGSFFFLIMNSYFGILSATTFKMVKENRIIYKEIKARMYSTFIFYLTKFLVDVIFMLIPVLLIGLPLYFLYDMNPHRSMLVQFMLVTLLSGLLGNATGFMIGNIGTDHKATIQLLPLFFVPFLILGGFLVNTAELPSAFQWLGYISPFKYMMELLLRAEFDRFPWGEAVRDQWDYNVGKVTCFAVIIAIILVWRTIAYFLIIKNVKRFN